MPQVLNLSFLFLRFAQFSSHYRKPQAMSNNPLTTKEDPGKEKIECIKKGVSFSAELSKMCQPVVASR